MKIAAVIPVAGSGKRFSGKVAKQYQLISGIPLIAVTIDRILSTELVNQVVLVHAPDHRQEIVKSIEKYAGSPVSLLLTTGGETRQESVFNGLQSVAADTDIVMVHDGVRPLISHRMISESIESAVRYGACITALPVSDTIKRVHNGIVTETVARENLWQIQTPQTFRYQILMDMHHKAREQHFTATDDAGLAEWLNITVHVIHGEETNIKITTAADMEFLKFYLEKQK